MRVRTASAIVEIPYEPLAHFVQRLAGMHGEPVAGGQAVIDAFESGADPVVLTHAQKNTAFSVLARWSDQEGDAALGLELVQLRDALAEEIAHPS